VDAGPAPVRRIFLLVSTLREEREAQVRRRLEEAERAAVDRYPGVADAIRRSVGRLRDGLYRAHSRPEAVDDRQWADYVVDLDRGLDELDAELDRAAGDRPTAAGPGVEEVLTIHASGLELQGWRLRFARFETAADLDEVRSRLAAAEAELERFRAEFSTDSGTSAAGLEQSIVDLRQAADRVSEAAK
jgi:hypothetical protein